MTTKRFLTKIKDLVADAFGAFDCSVCEDDGCPACSPSTECDEDDGDDDPWEDSSDWRYNSPYEGDR